MSKDPEKKIPTYQVTAGVIRKNGLYFTAFVALG